MNHDGTIGGALLVLVLRTMGVACAVYGLATGSTDAILAGGVLVLAGL